MQTNFIIKNKNPRIKSLGDNKTSHHVLGAFLSGQDMKMVQQEGDDTNCFVSLVVDTKGTYVAIVTRKVQVKKEVSILDIDKSYQFFGEGGVKMECSDQKETKEVSKEIIEYFDLEVERHEVPSDLGNTDDLKHLDTRFEEIEAKKAEQRKRSRTEPFLWGDWGSRDFLEGFHKSKQPDTKVTSCKNEAQDSSIDVKWTPDPRKIHEAVVHMLTCNLILNAEKIDLRQWVTRHILNVYNKIFGKDCLDELISDQMGAFANWRDFIVQHTLDFFDYSDAPDELFLDEDLILSKIARAIAAELSKYSSLKGNKEEVGYFIGSYIDALTCYIVE